MVELADNNLADPNSNNNNNNNNNILKLSVDLVKHGCFTNLGDYKSNWITTNSFSVRG